MTYSDTSLIVPDYIPTPEPTEAKPHPMFDIDLVNSDTSLQPLIQRLAFVREFQGLNILLYGPPGTGKTEFAKYMAQQLKLPVISLCTADILVSRIGASERILKNIFETARIKRCALIIDEADALLYARKDATMLWEAQLINQMIQLLDQHTQPVFCSTNAMEDLDPAILRRMMFKAHLGPLTQSQRQKAFEKYFKTPCPSYVDSLENLTISDFGLIYTKAKLLGYLHDTPSLLKLFYDEAVVKFNFKQSLAKRRKKSA